MTSFTGRMIGTAARASIVAAVALIAAGCGGDAPPTPDATPPPAAPSEALTSVNVTKAKALYAAQACAMCHGEQAEGGENGPALAGLAPYWNVERLVEYLDDPDAYRAANPEFDRRRTIEYEMMMPAYGHLSVDERQLLARWMLAR